MQNTNNTITNEFLTKLSIDILNPVMLDPKKNDAFVTSTRMHVGFVEMDLSSWIIDNNRGINLGEFHKQILIMVTDSIEKYRLDGKLISQKSGVFYFLGKCKCIK